MTADHSPDPGPEPTPEPEAGHRSDEQLIAAVRGGDPDRFEILYTRHGESARRLALALARSPSDADDLVAEAFAKLLSILREGGGPDAAFRAYLLTTLRNLFYERTRRDRRVRVTDDLSRHDAGVPFVDTAMEGLERSLVARAFARLPERWQTVLWHTQVEGESAAAVAPILGLTPNGVAALAYRARERLRQNYLREHISYYPTDECQSTIDRLGAYVRSGLSPRDRTVVDHHLTECRRCQVLFLELGDVNASLQTVLAPVVLGETAALTYVGSGSATGSSGFLIPIWSKTKRITRRRTTQAAVAGAAAVALAAALALALTGNPAPEPDPDAPDAPPAAGPEAPGAEIPDPEDPAAEDEPAAGTPSAGEPTTAPTTGPSAGATVDPAGADPADDDQAPGSGGPQPPAEDEPTPPDTPPGDDQPPPGASTPPDGPSPPPAGDAPDDPPDDEDPPDNDPSNGGRCVEIGLARLLRLELCLRW